MSQLKKETVVKDSSGLGFHYGYIILAVGILTVLGALGLARFGYTTIMPSMKTSLLLSNTQAGALATANMLGYTLFSLFGGFLAAKYGPRLIIGCSMFVTGATMLLTGFAGGIASLAAARFLTGVGSAGANIPMMGLVSAWFGPKRRGLAAGLLVGGSGLGLFVTGYLVPQVIATSPLDGWRYSWFVLGAVVIVLGTFSYGFLRNNPKDKGLLPIGVEPAGSPPPTADITVNQTEMSKTASGSSQQVAQDAKSIGSAVYSNPRIWHLGFVYLFYGFEYIIYGTFFSIALVSDKGFTQAGAGEMWAITGVIAIFSGILWGTLSDYLGRKYALAITFAMQAVCNYLLYCSSGAGNLLLFSVILYGLTCFSIPGIIAAYCGDIVGAKYAPAALGMVTLFLAVGQSMAPSVAGYIADVTQSFNGAFLLAAVVAVMGGVGALTLRKPKLNL